MRILSAFLTPHRQAQSFFSGSLTTITATLALCAATTLADAAPVQYEFSGVYVGETFETTPSCSAKAAPSAAVFIMTLLSPPAPRQPLRM